MKNLYIIVFMLYGIYCLCEAKNNFEIGVVVGKPAGVSGKYFLSEKNAIDGVVGLDQYSKFMFHCDYLWHNFNALKVNEGNLLFYYGGGFLTMGKKNYVQGKIGIEYLFDTNLLGMFIEIAPAVWTDFMFQSGIGVRYRLK